MITVDEQLRAYQRYCLYREWQSYLDARQAGLLATPNSLAYAVQVTYLLQADKKRILTQHYSQDKAILLEGFEALTANQADPLTYLQSLYERTYAQTQAQERALLRPVSFIQYWQAQLCLLFMTQPSYQLGVFAAQSVSEMLSHAEEVTVLSEPLSGQEQRLLQQLVGVSYVVITLVMSGWMHYGYELASAISRALLNHISVLFYLGQPLNALTRYIDHKVSGSLPTVLQPYWRYATDRFRWDEIGVLEKEPLVAFAVNLLIHVLLSQHPNKKLIGLAYTVVLMTIYLVTRLSNSLWLKPNQDTHEYTDTEINDLLLNESKHSQTTLCLTAMLGTSTDCGNDLIENLQAFHQRRRADIIAGERVKNKVLIPVNTHQTHWILLKLDYHKHASQPHRIDFFDPLGQLLPISLSKALQHAGLPTAQPLQAHDHTVISALQQDDYSCGTWVVHVAKLLIEQDDTALAKLNHLNIKRIRQTQMKQLYLQHNPHANTSSWIPLAIHIVLYVSLYSNVCHYLLRYFPDSQHETQPAETMIEARALSALGLFANATTKEIRRAYLSLAKQYHPDKNHGNETAAIDAFITIKRAYEYLDKTRSGP